MRDRPSFWDRLLRAAVTLLGLVAASCGAAGERPRVGLAGRAVAPEPAALERLRAELARRTGAEVALRAQIAFADGDGTSIYALWEQPRRVACEGLADPEVAPDESAPAPWEDHRCDRSVIHHPDTEEVAYECTRRELVLADAGAIVRSVPLGDECVLSEVARFALADPDRDGRVELAVRLRALEPRWNTNGSTAVERHVHTETEHVFAHDLRPQAEPLRGVEGGEWDTPRRRASVRLRDVDGDGHADRIVSETIEGSSLGEHVAFYDASADRWGADTFVLSAAQRQRVAAALDARWRGALDPELAGDHRAPRPLGWAAVRAEEGARAFVLYALGAELACARYGEGDPERERCEREIDERSSECPAVHRIALARLEGDGAVEIAADTGVQALCSVVQLARFELADVDWDHRPELLVDLHTADSTTYLGEFGANLRTIDVYDLALAPALPSIVSESARNPVDIEPSEATGRRLRFRDANADGHPDAILEEVTYRWSEDRCNTQDDLLAGEQPAEALARGECAGETVTRVLHYDPARDRFE